MFFTGKPFSGKVSLFIAEAEMSEVYRPGVNNTSDMVPEASRYKTVIAD